MYGSIAGLVKASAQGDAEAKKLADKIFKHDFRTPQGWRTFMASAVPGGDFPAMLADNVANWTHQRFHALFIVAWALHPTEKGAYMLKLTPQEAVDVQAALASLVLLGHVSARASSHLSGANAYSLSKDWKFLKGYKELLVQIERPADPDPYLFLKAEGHSLNNVREAALHAMSYASKSLTGKGLTASEALHRVAKARDSCLEERAAENYANAYERLLTSLGLRGRMVTVRQMFAALLQAADPNNPQQVTAAANTAALGQEINSKLGYLKGRRRQLAASEIDFSDDLEGELRSLANRMVETTAVHSRQYFHERRLTPAELTQGWRAIDARLG
ncbi:hypothetical protein [Rubrimonas cliftonensis]|uniref:Uncharacterized protein n=1 Tax=Rubrimonas cliftonensis TaxID=89524 RepID=A0A1H4BAX5_9RHOB|nr:hypothetical protein [Rubrimonas cliftonensis]SEA45293.1 hypothetical protein SAMN05444370_105110 [Rubrimonas cliftonensis]